MSEDPVWYNRTLPDPSSAGWSVSWSARPDLDAPIGITIEDKHGVTAIPLTVEQAQMLQRACEEAIRHAPLVGPATADADRQDGNPHQTQRNPSHSNPLGPHAAPPGRPP